MNVHICLFSGVNIGGGPGGLCQSDNQSLHLLISLLFLVLDII